MNKQLIQIVSASTLGAVLVAGAFFYNTLVSAETEQPLTLQRESHQHLYGNPRAATTIVEFSDVECPFCARLHGTLKTLVDESGGTINWEYRHLPLPNHRNAELGAVAVECVSELSSNTTAWEFLDAVLATQGQHNQQHYISVATDLGIGATAFEVCLAEEEKLARVRHDVAVARSFGGSGTPFSVIIFPDQSIKPVVGALPIEHWQATLGQ